MKISERYGTTLRIYDNGGRSADRYTIIPPRWAHGYRERDPRTFYCVACNAAPFHPQGVGMTSSAVPGKHLGRRVHWLDLPIDVQRLARLHFPEYAPTHDAIDVEHFIAGYIGAAIWTNAGDLSVDTGITDEMDRDNFAPETLKTLEKECRDFVRANFADIADATREASRVYDFGSAGHDFLLTRNGHGAGFWDGDLPEKIGERLTDAAHAFGNVDYYTGDDGSIYA